MSRTEMRNPKSKHIDKASTKEMLSIINEENMNSVKAVEDALPQIELACDIAAETIAAGGRIFYVGAGTSGRLAVTDASECPPTFGVNYETVIAVIAGGPSAVFKAAENVEDSAELGEKDLLVHNLTSKDTVVGISASGNAAYVVSALKAAKRIGCKIISLSCNEICKIAEIADVAIFTDTGAEVVTGSTRMKAGNAQKMVLNMISTCAMIKTGKVYENLMINLKPTNIKLKKRMIGIVGEILGTDETVSERLLEENDWNIRKAVNK